MPATSSTVRSAVRSALHTPGIARILVAFAMFRAAEFGVWIAMTAIAFEFGGVGEATAVMVAQLLPAAVTATFVGAWSGRWGARRVLVGGLYLQAAALVTVGALIALDTPRLLAYAAAVVASCAMTTTRPVISALVPTLVPGPRELSAANVAIGWIDGAALFVGPAVTAVCIAVIDPAAPFIVFGAGVAGTATLALAIPHPRGERRGSADREGEIPLRKALMAVARARGPRSVLLVLAFRSFVDGALDLLFVVVAIDILGGDGASAGWLNSAYGAGALCGAAASIVLVGRTALWPAVVAGTACAALGLGALGFADATGAAAVAFGIAGAGTAVLLIAARTLLQRVTDLALLCHAFSLSEAGDMTMLLLGSATVPVVVAIASPQWASAAIAVVLAAAVASQIGTVAWAERRSAAPIERIELLRRVELFKVLTAPALETLARESRPITAKPGEIIVREGARGAEFYVIRSGRVAVTRGSHELATLGAGDGFGELALLFDVPRTATVVAIETVELLAIGRDAFLVAVTGEQAATHMVATYIDAIDHPLGAWPGPPKLDSQP